MRRINGTLAATLCAVALHAAPARAGLRGEVMDYGETTAERDHPAPPSLDNHSIVPWHLLEGIHFINHDSSLTGQFCLRFGVMVRLLPDPGERLPDELTAVVTHPMLTRPDKVSSTRESFPTGVVGNTAYAGWTFDYPWELQPGEWTFAFEHQGRPLASKTFTVTVPTPIGSKCAADTVS